MNKILDKLPRWMLVLLVILLSAPAGYALKDHVDEDKKQSSDIRDLITVTENLKVVVEYNRELSDMNERSVEKQREYQMRMALLLGKLEGRLDN
jgi:hypothetical protein